MKKSLYHLPLEPYRQRYTEFLSTWEKTEFNNFFNITEVVDSSQPALLDINSGSVLDRVSRPMNCMAQMQKLVSMPGSSDLGRIWFSDFYTTGLDALPYSGRRFHASAFLWAQTFDRFDFTAKEHMNWMRPWEVMAFEIYEHVFVASTLLKDLIVTAIPNVESKVHVVGLPFNSKFVQDTWDKSFTPSQRYDVVYSSRWDTEKDPEFFLALVESCPDLSFAICTGWPEVRGNDRAAIERLRRIREKGESNLTVYSGLTKGQYYSVLAQSRVQFNCAKQDWVSFTLLEALAMGCDPLYPSTRSFPEALMHNDQHLYRPLDLEDAEFKLRFLLKTPNVEFNYRDAILNHHDQTLNRIAQIIKD